MKKGFLILIFLSITFFTAFSYIVIAGSGNWWPQCGVDSSFGQIRVVGGSSYICCDVQGTGAKWLSGSSCPCWDTGLGSPVVSPNPPSSGVAFQISCLTNGQKEYDCIDPVYSNDWSNQCGFSNWVGSIAWFNCAGLLVGTYTARCNARTGTGNNCCAKTTTLLYNVPPAPVCSRDGLWGDTHEYKCDSDKTRLRCRADGTVYDDTNLCDWPICGAYQFCNDLPPGYQYNSCGALNSFYWDRCSSTCGVEDFPPICKAPPDLDCTADVLCDEKTLGAACGSGGTCIAGCTCFVPAFCSQDDGGNFPLVAGSCTDTSSHSDSCSGTTLTEYYCSGAACAFTSKQCQDYETLYCNLGNIYREEWQCSGSPGYCNNGAANTLVQTCNDTCSDTDGGQTYTTLGTVTDNNLCSAGQTSCPSSSYTDYCVNAATLREYYCSGSGYTFTDYSCANLGVGYTCSGGRCVLGVSCGDSIIGSGEQCDPPATNSNQCPQSTSNCDYATRRYCTRDVFGNCNSGCQCALDSWSCGTADDANYCNNCASHCGDGTCNCGETSLSCPGDNCGVVCTPNGCNGNCPAGCTVAQDPDCGCSNSNGCCGIGCTNINDNDCAAATYSATFSQTGIPAGTTWGVTVGGTRYTLTGPSQTVSGLSGSVAYSYDDPVPGGSGIRYDCTSSCSGSVSSSTTITASYGTQYYLTMQANPAAGGTVSPASGWYNIGSSISISATNNAGYTFSSWSDGGAQTHSITVSSAMTRTANFQVSTSSITVTSSPATGAGYVTVDGSAITTPQSYSWAQGSTHTLAAISPVSCGSGCRYVFTSWSDGGAQSHSITTPAAATTYTANYQLQYYLTMQANPAAGGTVSPASGWYNTGSSVSISATNNAGYTFSSWSDGGAQTHSITVSSAMTRTANFLSLFTITITSSPTGGGYVTVDGVAIITPQSYSWTAGSTHTIAANSPVSCGAGCQYVYTSWSDGGAQSHSITTPAAATTYTANFQRQYYLTMQANPAAGGTVSPASSWRNSGASVSISATANAGYTFSSWSGSGTGSYTGTNNPATITMNGAITETANFLNLVTVNSSPSTGPGFVIVDGAAIITPQTYSWAQGSSHTISANSPVSCGVGCQFYYTSWSDAGLQSHGVTISGSGTYTANFQRQYYLTMLANPATGGTVVPSSGWRNVGAPVGILATGTGSCMFASWTGIGTGSYTGINDPSNVIMNSAINETANFDCGTANSMNFTGYLNYSSGEPVKNSLIKMTIKNNTLGYEKSGIDETNQLGFFFVKIENIPDVIMNSNLDISIYVLGDVEALYDCWYNHTSGKCCSVPLSGPC